MNRQERETSGLSVYLWAIVITISGSRISIDKGLIDGLRQGDQGRVCYVLSVNDEKRPIETVACQVAEVHDQEAAIELLEPQFIHKGFIVGFSVPVDRLTPRSLVELGKARLSEGRFDPAIAYFKRVKETLPDDPLVNELIQETEKQKREKAERDQQALKWQEEQQKAYSDLAEAEKALSAGHLSKASDLVAAVLRVIPDSKPAGALKEAIEHETDIRENMFLIEAGTFEIGLPAYRAKYYNQQPRFKTQLPAFHVDRSPTNLTNQSYLEAEEYCRKRGKRLPTEFELEVVLDRRSLETSENAEWTSSWYLPYPGNKFFEKAYGETYRVIRGPGNFRIRTFLLPADRSPDTTFRCACPAR